MTALREALAAAISAVETWDKFCSTDDGRSEQPRQLILTATLIPLFPLIRDHRPALLAALDDADRYRWLLDNGPPCALGDDCECDVSLLEAAIDAARKP